jgi:hypothetical protein
VTQAQIVETLLHSEAGCLALYSAGFAEYCGYYTLSPLGLAAWDQLIMEYRPSRIDLYDALVRLGLPRLRALWLVMREESWQRGRFSE